MIQTVHHHTKIGCLRNNKCRFNISVFPMPRTMVLNPAEIDKNRFSNVLKKISSILNQNKLPDSFDIFLKELSVSFSDYIMAIRSTIAQTQIFLKRSPRDAYIVNLVVYTKETWIFRKCLMLTPVHVKSSIILVSS